MNKEIDCAVVKDLLPNYIDKLTSNETNQIIENHLSICEDCTKECNDMMGTIKLGMDKAPKRSDLKNFLNKTKRMYLLKGIAFSIGIIGILVSFIVDIAVNRKLTWSLIVDASVLYIYAAALTAVFCKKGKIIMTTLVSSILVLPLLYIIKIVVNKNYIIDPYDWFQLYALPITLIWLAIIWFVILVRKLFKLKIWSTMGIAFLLGIFGSAFSNAIAIQGSVSELYTNHLEWIDSISYFLCAILCFIIGYKRKGKCKF